MTPDEYIPNQWYPILDGPKLKQRKPVGVTFHGLRFDSAGRCVLIPANGERQPVSRGFDVPRRIVREAHGLIWYWHGDSEPFEEILRFLRHQTRAREPAT